MTINWSPAHLWLFKSVCRSFARKPPSCFVSGINIIIIIIIVIIAIVIYTIIFYHHTLIISPPSWTKQFENEENCQNMSSPVKAFKSMRLFKQATVACGPCELGVESLDNMGEGSQLLARSLEMPLSLLAAVHNPTKNIGLRQFHQFLIT